MSWWRVRHTLVRCASVTCRSGSLQLTYRHMQQVRPSPCCYNLLMGLTVHTLQQLSSLSTCMCTWSPHKLTGHCSIHLFFMCYTALRSTSFEVGWPAWKRVSSCELGCNIHIILRHKHSYRAFYILHYFTSIIGLVYSVCSDIKGGLLHNDLQQIQ